jgi:hypothetical protein
VTADVPLGGVGRAGVGTGGGTKASTGVGGTGGRKKLAGCAGAAGGTPGGAGAGAAGGAGTGTCGGVLLLTGAGPAGAGAGGGTGAATLAACAATSDSGWVPHGLRTLPACTVTVNEDANPPVLIVTTVVPAL